VLKVFQFYLPNNDPSLLLQSKFFAMSGVITWQYKFKFTIIFFPQCHSLEDAEYSFWFYLPNKIPSLLLQANGNSFFLTRISAYGVILFCSRSKKEAKKACQNNPPVFWYTLFACGWLTHATRVRQRELVWVMNMVVVIIRHCEPACSCGCGNLLWWIVNDSIKQN